MNNSRIDQLPLVGTDAGQKIKAWRKPRTDGLMEALQPLLVFAAVGVAVIQKVQTLQSQLLTVVRHQVANSQQPTDQERSVKGALPIALRAKAADKIGLLVAKDNTAEAAVVNGLQVIPIQNLRKAMGFLEREVKISPTRVDLPGLFDHPSKSLKPFSIAR